MRCRSASMVRFARCSRACRGPGRARVANPQRQRPRRRRRRRVPPLIDGAPIARAGRSFRRERGVVVKMRRWIAPIVALTSLALCAGSAWAQKKYDQGASDTEIKIGQTMPYSGPASAYGTIGKAEAAYFKMI